MSDVDHGAHYRHEYKGIKIDPARISVLYGVKNPLQMGILKKVLRAGGSIKSTEQDVKDIICAAERWLEMIEEDREQEESK